VERPRSEGTIPFGIRARHRRMILGEEWTSVRIIVGRADLLNPDKAAGTCRLHGFRGSSIKIESIDLRIEIDFNP
jgi:hypothetical protein